jgi:hypothetical protein
VRSRSGDPVAVLGVLDCSESGVRDRSSSGVLARICAGRRCDCGLFERAFLSLVENDSHLRDGPALGDFDRALRGAGISSSMLPIYSGGGERSMTGSNRERDCGMGAEIVRPFGDDIVNISEVSNSTDRKCTEI